MIYFLTGVFLVVSLAAGLLMTLATDRYLDRHPEEEEN